MVNVLWRTPPASTDHAHQTQNSLDANKTSRHSPFLEPARPPRTQEFFADETGTIATPLIKTMLHLGTTNAGR